MIHLHDFIHDSLTVLLLADFDSVHQLVLSVEQDLGDESGLVDTLVQQEAGVRQTKGRPVVVLECIRHAPLTRHFHLHQLDTTDR